jgi:lincosamide nucleotidyltransferase A/C/D/E
MKAGCVIDFWHAAQKHGLEICIDGGWAVDAVLKRQTRPHSDLDIALPAVEVPALRRLLAARGYGEVYRPDSWEHNFVLEDPQGRLIDVHAYVLNPDGSNAGGVSYVADQVSGSGVILGVPVRCVPAHWLIQSHTGYELRGCDWHDVRLLCKELDLAIPPGFEALAASIRQDGRAQDAAN